MAMATNDDEMDLDDPQHYQAAGSPAAVELAEREREFDRKYPRRPHNKNKTLPFHTLLSDLFGPLLKNQKPIGGPARKNVGPDHGPGQGTREIRRQIIDRYISRWRSDVGRDFFPAMRIIVPEKDRDRAMYGIKEKALAKYLIKIMKIDKNSDDGFNILNWKLPSKGASSAAGDFPSRCYDVLQKRPSRSEYGDMTIGQVNDQLDLLSIASTEQQQLPIIADFYRRMNAEEMTCLIRIVLRQMKIGATEKTILDVFHPDAGSLFNVSSSLRRVCWELHDETIRLETDDRAVSLMQCYQPQLASFDGNNFPKLVDFLVKYATDDDKEFWIEEKLDGERIQMHMQKAQDGKFEFKFFSRKAKDYTYLYGKALDDNESALTQHLSKAFDGKVESLVLDGEMITWDPELDRQAAFGTLKTAALAEKANPYGGKERPLYRIFDILLFNDKLLTQYTLRDRRKVLDRAIKPVKRRFEIHEHTVATTADEIDAKLREMIETAAEGLVLKNPRSSYTLNERTRDWLKVKPEYMQGFGESLDCLIIAGYYGSGKRGGILSSFLCGLRADKHSKRFLSFFKVGGGLSAGDYAHIQHKTDGKWHDYNVKKPPTEYITLAGPLHAPREKPDCWIKPEDSLVVEVKAATIGISDEFATNLTLRFPRFKKFRPERDWTNSLTLDEFKELKSKFEDKKAEEDEKKEFEAEQSRSKRRALANRKKPLKVVGYGLPATDNEDVKTDSDALLSTVFHGLTFFVVTESMNPKKTKLELETIIKRHAGKIVQTNLLPGARPSKSSKKGKDESTRNATEQVVCCIADRRTVKVASLEKAGDTLLVRPAWIFDSIAQAKRDFANGLKEKGLPFEPSRHLFFTPAEERGKYDQNVDRYGDGYFRETTVEELAELFKTMNDLPKRENSLKSDEHTAPDPMTAKTQELLMQNSDDASSGMKGWMFSSNTLYFDKPTEDTSNHTHGSDVDSDVAMSLALKTARFAGARIVHTLEDRAVTQIIASSGSDLRGIRTKLAAREGGSKIPRVVTPQWILESWQEGTQLDDERFTAR